MGSVTGPGLNSGGSGSPFLDLIATADAAYSATAVSEPRDISGNGKHASWGGSGDPQYDVKGTRITPAMRERFIHHYTEDDDEGLTARTSPIDWRSLDGVSFRAKWKSIDPWHTDTYPQSLGVVQGGNGHVTEEDDQIIEAAMGISYDGKIRFTGRGLGNNDFGLPGQFNPAAGVEVRVDVHFANGTITAYTKSGGRWVQVGDTLNKGSAIELVNDSFENSIHKFATGYGKGWFSYCEARALDGTLLRRFDAAQAYGTSAGETWIGADGREWTLGTSDAFGRVPAIIKVDRSAWLTGAGDTITITAPLDGELEDSSKFSVLTRWTPLSGPQDDEVLHGMGHRIWGQDSEWFLALDTVFAEGELLVADSGAFGEESDGAGTLDPIAITNLPAGEGQTIHVVDISGTADRSVSFTSEAGAIIALDAAPDFSDGVVVIISNGNVFIKDNLGATDVAEGEYDLVSGQEVEARLVGDQVYALVDGRVVLQATTSSAVNGLAGVTEVDEFPVSNLEIRETTAPVQPQVSLGELNDGEMHTVVSLVDEDVWRVRINGIDVVDIDPVESVRSEGDLQFDAEYNQLIHDFALFKTVLSDEEIAILEDI